jgi:hypothetical protein
MVEHRHDWLNIYRADFVVRVGLALPIYAYKRENP